MFKELVDQVDLHVFGVPSESGMSAAVYAVITQVSRVSQGLIAAKSRLAKKDLTILRQELVAGHMAANLVDNMKTSLQGEHSLLSVKMAQQYGCLALDKGWWHLQAIGG